MKHCLIIDSSPLIRKVAGTILKGLGNRVEEADCEATALAHCQLELPGAIFIDWRLPNSGALSFLEQLKGLSRLRKPRIIVWTTVNDPEMRRIAQNAGADEIMLKPFDRPAIIESLGQVAAAA